MTDEIDQKRNNNKVFPSLFITHMPALGSEPFTTYCMNCKRFWKSDTTSTSNLRIHMNAVHGFKST